MRRIVAVAALAAICLSGCRGAWPRSNRGAAPSPASPGASGPLMPTPDPAFDGGAPLYGPAFPTSSLNGGRAELPVSVQVRHGPRFSEPTAATSISGPVEPLDDGWRAAPPQTSTTGEPALFPVGDVELRPVR